MGSVIGIGFIVFFALVNALVWGDGGYVVHLLGYPVSAYPLVWMWIGMIAITYGANCVIHGGQKYPIALVVCVWWAANILMTSILNLISYRGIEEQGETIFGMPSLILDFTGQCAIDLISIIVVWLLVSRGTLTASVPIMVFCGYLVANLFGHTSGAYNLMAGIGAETTAQAYDAFMYLTFTIMLALQVLGAGGDAILRWSGSNVDLYRDIRPIIHRFVSRNLFLR